MQYKFKGSKFYQRLPYFISLKFTFWTNGDFFYKVKIFY